MSSHHDHQHTADQTADQVGDRPADDLYSQETWDARYAGSTRLWSGNPNPQLVAHISDLQRSDTAPGTALDVGAGEGADAVWLASRGWQVTALDVSEVALSRVAEHAAETGVGDRVTTLHHDLMSGVALPGTYDLVSAQFWHPPAETRAEHVARIGAAVRRGGVLLIVGHHPVDVTAEMVASGHPHVGRVFTPEQIAEILSGPDWDVRVAASPTREVAGAEGPVTLTDSVVLAVRR